MVVKCNTEVQEPGTLKLQLHYMDGRQSFYHPALGCCCTLEKICLLWQTLNLICFMQKEQEGRKYVHITALPI